MNIRRLAVWFSVGAVLWAGVSIGLFASLTNAQESESEIVIAFSKHALEVSPQRYTALLIGADQRMYASSVFGQILRWDIAEDGSLTNEQMVFELEGRIIIGMTFAPDSTPEETHLWISHNTGVLTDAPNFSSVIEKVTIRGFNSDNQQWSSAPYVVGLPRSWGDHMVNGLAFGPDGALYVNVGSLSAMGDRDAAWGMRPETILSGAVLRVDTAALEQLPNLPLDVRTAEEEADGALLDEKNYALGDPRLAERGLYDPLAPNAPVTLYATGLRNIYDLVWHTNGNLYIPINGSSAGGNAPATPNPLPPQCNYRIDVAIHGAYTEPMVPAATNILDQKDYLAHIVKGGFYGHPNPTRCEWVLYGGNPTNEEDPAERGAHYPVGTLPDRNFRGFIYTFGLHTSSNGIIEYKSDAFDGALKGKLMVVNYSVGSDIVILELGVSPTTGETSVIGSKRGTIGMTNFQRPLDLVEDPRNGNIYVSEFSAEKITLLRPDPLTPEIVSNRITTTFRNINREILAGSAKFTMGGLFGAAAGLVGIFGLYRQRSLLLNVPRQLAKAAQNIAPFAVVAAILAGVGYFVADSAYEDLRTARNNYQRATIPHESVVNLVNSEGAPLPPDGVVAVAMPNAPVIDGPPEALAGQTLFNLSCASCHGMDAKGLQSLGLTLVGSKFIAENSDTQLVEFIKIGRDPFSPDNVTGGAMPAYGGNPSLTDEDLLNIIAYIRVLQTLPEAE